jgi:hypothetical protein
VPRQRNRLDPGVRDGDFVTVFQNAVGEEMIAAYLAWPFGILKKLNNRPVVRSPAEKSGGPVVVAKRSEPSDHRVACG